MQTQSFQPGIKLKHCATSNYEYPWAKWLCTWCCIYYLARAFWLGPPNYISNAMDYFSLQLFFFIDLLKTFPRLELLLIFTSLICESEVRVVEAAEAKTGCLGDMVKGGYGYTRHVGRHSAENFIYQLASCSSPLFSLCAYTTTSKLFS